MISRLNNCIVSIIAALVFFSYAEDGVCVCDDSLWAGFSMNQKRECLARLQKKANSGIRLSNKCVRIGLQRIHEMTEAHHRDTLLDFITEYCRMHSEARVPLLFSALRLGLPQRYSRKWKRVVMKCAPSDRSYTKLVRQKLERDDLAGADSLLQVLSWAGMLQRPQYLHWIRTLILQSRWDKAAAVACNATVNDPAFGATLRSHLVHTAREVSRDTLGILLSDYTACMARNDALTDTIMEWASSVYDRYRLHEKKVEFYLRIDGCRGLRQRECLRSAEWCFERGSPDVARKAAHAVYRSPADDSAQHAAAGLLLRFFLRSDDLDSVLRYIDAAQPLSRVEKAGVIVLYQRMRRFEKARGVINTLREGLMRDTAVLRQYLFADSVQHAAEYGSRVLDSAWYWQREPLLRDVWKLRLAVFGAGMKRCLDLYDSLVPDPRHKAAGTLLYYGYVLKRMRSDSVLFGRWARLHYLLYTHRSRRARTYCDSVAGGNNEGAIMAVELARHFARQNKYDHVIDVYHAFSHYDDPGIVFYYAHALLQRGKTARGCSYFQKLLLRSAAGMYGAKAALVMRIWCHENE